jgi:hypothetical protein
MSEKSEIKWLPLHSVPGRAYAEMVMEVLKQRGIPCYIRSLFGSGALGTVQGAGLPGAKDHIMVPEERFEEAEEILTDMLDHI